MEPWVSRIVTIKVFLFLLFALYFGFFFASFLFISKMASKDRRGAAAYNTDEVLTDKHGMCFVAPEGVSMEEALLAIGKLIGEHSCSVSNEPQDRCFRLKSPTRTRCCA